MSYKKYYTIYKDVGETPLQAITRLRDRENLDENIPCAYAGRLDPMAEGTLLIVVGNECKNQTKYHDLDKEYEFEILIGFESDTQDVLGLTEYDSSNVFIADEIKNVLPQFIGKIKLPYPVFSSKTVEGKPLFLWKLEGKINEIDIPTKSSEIYELEFIDTTTISKESLHTSIFKKINSIKPVVEESKKLGADFRREEIRKEWDVLFDSLPESELMLIKIRCVCSSGTYMRTLASEIAKVLGTKGLAYSIKRTKIGKYQKIGPLGFWTKKF